MVFRCIPSLFMNSLSMNSFKKFARCLGRSFLIAIFISASTLVSSIGIEHYKDSYTRYTPENRHLSPLHGIATHERLIRGLYFFKPLGQETATNRLCKHLFHSNDNRRHFHVVMLPSLPAHHFSPRVIAELVKFLHEKSSVTENFNEKNVAEALKKIITEDPAFKASRDKESKSTQKNITSRLNKFSQDLVAACRESGLFSAANSSQTTPQPLYTKYTPLRILQAFLYAKFSNKESLDEYNQSLATYFKDNQNNTEQTTLNNTEQATLTVGNTPQVPAVQNEAEAHQYEIDIITSQLASALPALDQYRDAFYTFKMADGKDTSVPFSDCMDNSLRHLFHILAYNHETKSFDLSRLITLSAPGKQLNPALVQYFQTFTTPEEANRTSRPTEAGRIDGHSAWATLISNIRGIGYARFFEGDRGSCLHRSLFPQDFTEQSVILEDITYRLIDGQESHLYEAEVSLRNVIVALNELLGLALFDLNDPTFIVKTTENGFCSPTFVDHYWPLLLARLNWSCNQTNLHAQKINITIQQSFNEMGSPNSVGSFNLYLNQQAHADITPATKPSIRGQDNTSSTSFLRQSSDQQLYRLLIKATTKRALWDLLRDAFIEIYKATAEQESLKQTLSDLCAAYYQSLLVNELALEDIGELYRSEATHSFQQGIELLKQIKELDPERFLEIAVNAYTLAVDDYREKNAIERIELLYGDKDSFLKALTETENCEALSNDILAAYSDRGYLSQDSSIGQAFFDNQFFDNHEKLFKLMTDEYRNISGSLRLNPVRLTVGDILSPRRIEEINSWLTERFSSDEQFFKYFSTIILTICNAIKTDYSDCLYSYRDNGVECKHCSDHKSRFMKDWLPTSWLKTFFQNEKICLTEIFKFCKNQDYGYFNFTLAQEIKSFIFSSENDKNYDFENAIKKELNRKVTLPEWVMCPDIARMILVLLKLFPSDENWLVMVLEHERLTAEIMEIIFREINFRMMQFDSLTLPQCISKLIPQEKCRQLELDAEHNPHSVLEKFEFYPQSCRLKAAYHLSLDGNDNNNLATLCNNLCIRPDGCYEISQLNLYDKFYELRNARIRSFIDLFARREDEVLAYIRKNTEIKETLLKIPELWPASWIEAAHFRPSTSLTDQRGGDSSPDEELRGEEFERAAKRPRLEPETEN